MRQQSIFQPCLLRDTALTGIWAFEKVYILLSSAPCPLRQTRLEPANKKVRICVSKRNSKNVIRSHWSFMYFSNTTTLFYCTKKLLRNVEAAFLFL